MKLLTLLSTATLLASATARSNIHNTEVVIQDNDLTVPGENPLEHCADATEDLLTIEKVDLSPNPPKAGTTLCVTASGILAADIEDGAQVHLTVKYGLITIIRQTADLCETVKNVELECPLKAGNLTLTKDVDLPRQIPPGTYTVQAEVLTKDDLPVTCLKAKVQFHAGGSATSFVGNMFKEGL